jgi:hypothetical protein
MISSSTTKIPGFGVRIRAGGSRKFVLHYRIGGNCDADADADAVRIAGKLSHT